MPIYEYACKACGEHFDIKQSFTDAPLTIHESCGGELRKVFQPAPILFKGSGWYVTDSRTKPPGEDGSASAATNGAAKTDAKGSESKSETKTEKTETKGEAKSEKPSSTKSETSAAG